MGLLDDAIREHLDLKRRHGADPTEVERAEREALGPVRRTPERVPEDESDFGATGLEGEQAAPLATASDAEPAHGGLQSGELEHDELDHDAEDFADEREPAVPLPHDEDERPVYETEEDDYESEESGYEAGPRPAYDHASELAAEAPDGPAAPETPAAPEAEGSWSFEDDQGAAPDQRGYADHTVEFDVEEALGDEPHHAHAEPEPAAEGEDVLEETPEFLQDTPDHDRLWFEQRPPRDFDFDK